MNPTHPLLLSLLTLVGGATAQTVTFPSDHTGLPDGASSQGWFPYSYGIGRFQAVYEAWDLQIPAGRQITRIGFRADPATISYGYMLQLEVRIGATDKTAGDLDSTYDANWLGTPTVAFGPAIYALPDLNNPLNPNPDGQYVWLTLTTPVTWNPAHNLLVEWRVHFNSNGGAGFQYELDVPSFVSPIVTGPQGCLHSGGQRPVLTSDPVRVGGLWTENLYTAPANQLAVLLVALNSTLVSPYPLQPIVPGIAAACQGQVLANGALTLVGVTGPSGYGYFQASIPDLRGFNDTILATQAVCFDFFAPGGIVVSNGEQVQIGIDPAMSVLWSQGSATATTGSVYSHWGPVTLFAHN